jgi:F-type H+-transporting ATPase subunit gamma
VPKPRAILKRKKAVQNIAKITKTMQMIATARFKKAFDRAVAARPYTDRMGELVAQLSSAAGTYTHPLLEAREPKRGVLLAVASNRGLCGGYNSGVLRATVAAWREAKAAGRVLSLVVAGKKLANGLKFQGAVPDAMHTHFEDKPTFAQVDALVTPLVEAYAKGEIDEVRVAYTKFESSSRQRPVVERVLPFEVPKGAAKGPARDWIFDPDAATILSDLIPRSVRLRLFQAFLDAAVSEQVARMTAMKSATDNANDMIKSLGRTFNRSRQSQITTELTEIMGGAAALE